jgi:hypothetical protein
VGGQNGCALVSVCAVQCTDDDEAAQMDNVAASGIRQVCVDGTWQVGFRLTLRKSFHVGALKREGSLSRC